MEIQKDREQYDFYKENICDEMGWKYIRDKFDFYKENIYYIMWT